ncbi:hypothetical protein NHL50_06560 [Acidimicrobiia bacterium EGI L10123]|uniref:hypothetical protein n=1 Tax=Salinilacustrithrix flava TaxID=2957203 RepID=UPI003D7C1533|nr:hypothetical protein [Acidimicrobiia bacterium EGI L10123]
MTTPTETDPTSDAERREGVEGTTDEPSVVETIATTATGVALGGAVLWFLAPICFVC